MESFASMYEIVEKVRLLQLHEWNYMEGLMILDWETVNRMR